MSISVPASGGAARADIFEGLTLYGYGHSFMAGTAGAHSTNAKYLDRINKRHNFGAVSNRGVSGDEAQTTFVPRLVNGSSSTAWVSGTKGLVVLDMMINDVRQYGNDANAIASFKDILTAAIRVLRSSVRRADNHASLTYTGTWLNTADGNLMDGAVQYTNTVGDYVEIAVSGSTEYTIFSARFRQGQAGGTLQISVDGGAAVEANCDGGLPAGSSLFWHTFGVTVSGLSTGAHTIRVTKKAGDTDSAYVDGWCDLSTTPPLIIVLKDPVLNTWTGIGAPHNNGSDAAQAAYATAVDEVAALFSDGTVIAASPASWDKTTMIAADTVHPNDKGMDAFADGIDTVLAGVTAWRNGLHVL